MFSESQLLSPRSTVHNVDTVSQVYSEKGWDMLGVQSLAFVYGYAHLNESNKPYIKSIENHIKTLPKTDRLALKFQMGLVLATFFSDAFLAWSNSESEMVGSVSAHVPKSLQAKTVTWLTAGISSFRSNQQALHEYGNAMNRILSGDSILDQPHYDKLAKALSSEEKSQHFQREKGMFGKFKI